MLLILEIKFVALLAQEKWKKYMNELENDDFDILWALWSVYKKIRKILFPWLLVNFKQRYIITN